MFCRINGRLCNVSMLKEISSYVIDIHGQHEHQSLLNSKNHLSILDLYAGDDIQKIINNYRDERTKYKAVQKKIKNILGEGNKEQRIDILNYQLAEINSADLHEGEEDELKEKREFFANMQKNNGLFKRCLSIYKRRFDRTICFNAYQKCC